MAYAPYIGGELPNIATVTKRLDPDGNIADIAEILSEANPILQDMPMIEGNLPTGHRYDMRSDLPVAQLRMLNYGTRPTKSETIQMDDSTCMIEDWAEVDKDVANLNGNSAEFRLSEDIPHIEGIGQKAAGLLLYGDSGADPKSMLGIAPRYGSLTMTAGIPAGKPIATVNSAHLPNIISMGGTGANLTSIYFVVWGASTVFGIYPKGMVGGLVSEDLGLVTLYDNDGGRYRGYQSHYQWKMGLCVKDWRYIGRICNIDLSSLLTTESAQQALYKAMIRLMHSIPTAGRNKGVFYCGSAIAAALDLAATEKGNLAIGSYTDAFGKPQTAFRGRPIKECDQILETETVLT